MILNEDYKDILLALSAEKVKFLHIAPTTTAITAASKSKRYLASQEIFGF